ncbi:methyl-accepting chemotaxis protein [Modicisalibacter coralii]|uniref:methyl-accepting chemotaxis protein n=1 Tax=Modicisalibacter coralii TaxID=2304602 RepID=UPI001396CE4E|nr:methyl-accepting chemotaxis protein [Halomonas coralii]
MKNKTGMRRLGIVSRVSILVAAILVVGFVALSWVLTWAAERQVAAEMTERVTQQQAQVGARLTLFDQTLHHEISRLLNLFEGEFDAAYALAPDERIEVAGRQTPALRNGARVLNGDYGPLDEFTRAAQAPVTIFARDGDDFVRVTTSLKKADGSRAVGTLLDRNNASYARLIAGEPYTGLADLFGTRYITQYRPIEDAGGRVIGATFIGIDITRQSALLEQQIRDIRFDESGFVMLVDAREGHRGQVIAGGPFEGRNLDEVLTPQGQSAYAALSETDSGRFDTAIAADDGRPRTVYFTAYPERQWTIVSTVFDDEVFAAIDTLRNYAIVGALLVALALGLLLYRLQRRMISRPLDALGGLAEDLAKGDLSRRIAVRRDDEIGRLTTAMNGIGDGLARIVGDVRRSTQSVYHAAGEIAQSSEDLASRSDQSASNLQETSASLEEITSTVANTADAARQATQLVGDTRDLAGQGNDAMARAQSSMNDINASAEKIGDIITLIDSIAFQTNILALNASVEAARAGEHGRGFAVVAQEVRTLATRSSDAASEIRGLIDTSLTHTRAGAEQVERAARTVSSILDGVERVNDVIGEISSGASEQSDGIGQINVAVTELDTMIQQNAAMVTESSAAAEEMRSQARHLSELMERFHLGDSAPAPSRAETPRPDAAAELRRPSLNKPTTQAAETTKDDWEAF